MRKAAADACWANREEKNRCVQFAEYIINNDATVRTTAAHFGISKSTVHKDVSEKLQHVDRALYVRAKSVMDKNKAERHIRGGQATKKKFSSMKRKR